MYKSILLFSIVIFQYGCTTCDEQLISSVSSLNWEADVRFRACGSVSGYIVAIYEKGKKPPGEGEGDLEPFKATYLHSRNEAENPSPIKIEWIQVKWTPESRQNIR